MDEARNNMRQQHWIVQAVRDLGFPIVVSLILLVKMPTAIREAIAADNAVRKEAMIGALKEQANAFKAAVDQLKELTVEARALRAQSSTVQGLIMGKYRCPPRQCLSSAQISDRDRIAAHTKFRVLLNNDAAAQIVERERAADAEMEKDLAKPIPFRTGIDAAPMMTMPPVVRGVQAAAPHSHRPYVPRPYENGLPWEKALSGE